MKASMLLLSLLLALSGVAQAQTQTYGTAAAGVTRAGGQTASAAAESTSEAVEAGGQAVSEAAGGVADAIGSAPRGPRPLSEVKGPFQMPMPAARDLPPNTMTEAVSGAAKDNAVQSMMLANPLSLRDMISLMVSKKKANEGLSFDDVVDSMKLRANYHNFKFVGHSPLYKDVEAITGKPSPRVEIFSFCDAMIARQILDYAPEFVAFLPCRIAVIEDANGAIWLVTLDWNVKWMDTSANPDRIPAELREAAIHIRFVLDDMMDAAANGDL